jgi:hypothetical protein
MWLLRAPMVYGCRFPREFRNGDLHDVHDSNAADQQRYGSDAAEQSAESVSITIVEGIEQFDMLYTSYVSSTLLRAAFCTL